MHTSPTDASSQAGRFTPRCNCRRWTTAVHRAWPRSGCPWRRQGRRWSPRWTAAVAPSVDDPASGDLTGAGHDDVVVASNEIYGAPSIGSDLSFAGVTASAAGSSGRLYAIDGPTGKVMPGWPVAMPGIIQNELPLI